MMLFRGFVDVLFILLFSTMAMLANSIRLSAVDTAPARVGSGGLIPVAGSSVHLVVVAKDDLLVNDKRTTSIGAAAADLRDGNDVLIVAATPDVSHHRIMRVWSGFQQLGYPVKLAAKPEQKPEND